MSQIVLVLLLACTIQAQTTQPTRQIIVAHNGKVLRIIVAAEVAGRVANGTQTDEDRAAVAVAVELELGHVPFHTSNPCHLIDPDAGGPHLHDEGRKSTNCEASITPRSK